MQRHRLAFASRQVDPVESCQRPDRELDAIRNLAGCAEVNLRHFVRVNCACVLDVNPDIEATIGGLLDL